jgi:TonB family protein
MSDVAPAGAGGDVLVLFQTDASGRVIRTAVPLPVGGGLDAVAEEIVREMRFVPPVVDGQPTGLRSQVVVRFE